jgi:hypothetical protein
MSEPQNDEPRADNWHWQSLGDVAMKMLSDDGGHLVCPVCRGILLHQCAVFVYCRREDAAQTIVTRITGTASNDPEIESLVEESRWLMNPSNRRDGIGIKFYCEGCPNVSELTIAQHKGQTLVEWRSTELRYDAGTGRLKASAAGQTANISDRLRLGK